MSGQSDLTLARSAASLPGEFTSANADFDGGGAVRFGLLQMADVNGRPDLVTLDEASGLIARAFEMIRSGVEESTPADRAAF